jgi:hypothetical protein
MHNKKQRQQNQKYKKHTFTWKSTLNSIATEDLHHNEQAPYNPNFVLPHTVSKQQTESIHQNKNLSFVLTLQQKLGIHYLEKSTSKWLKM